MITPSVNFLGVGLLETGLGREVVAGRRCEKWSNRWDDDGGRQEQEIGSISTHTGLESAPPLPTTGNSKCHNPPKPIESWFLIF